MMYCQKECALRLASAHSSIELLVGPADDGGAAQVMSPAKPDFSPSSGMGQRRRLCAVLEGIAEKHDICQAAMHSFQVGNTLVPLAAVGSAHRSPTAHADHHSNSHLGLPQTVHAVLEAFKDPIIKSVVPALSARAKDFLPSSPRATAAQPAAAGASARPGGACMEGSRVFANELQQLLLSLGELDIGVNMAPALHAHAEAMKVALHGTSCSSPLSAAQEGQQAPSPPLYPSSSAEFHASLSASKRAAAAAEQSLACLQGELQAALAARNEAAEMLALKDALLQEAHGETTHMTEQMSRTCAQVALLSQNLQAMADLAGQKDVAHQAQVAALEEEQDRASSECARLQVRNRALDTCKRALYHPKRDLIP